jgi:16S rRNA (adenine1518-N6/adenine1519-N6)-dimethyltransferase
VAKAKSLAPSQGFRPKKRLGQHFLKDPAIIDKMIARAGFDPSCTVLEIGAGLGALTLPLAGSVRRVLAVEKDPQLLAVLQKNLDASGMHNVTPIAEDILRLDLGALDLPAGQTFQVLGNLPFNISSPVLEKLILNRHLMRRAVLTFQREVARRLMATPGNKEYGAMTVLVQYHARVSPLLEIAKEAFHPKPKVGSMVLELDFTKPHRNRAKDEKHFKGVVKAAFAHRRKTLLNGLKGVGVFPTPNILRALERCGIEPGKRAETLDIDDFLCLSGFLAVVDK